MSQPKYQLLDPLPADVYDALKADIAETGMVYPVVLDEAGAVIDGHHRKRIAEELGIEYPATVLPGLSEEEKVDRSLALNLTGRKQSREEKRETIRRYLLRRPNVSDRHAARVTGASAPTVADVRRELERHEKILHVSDRVASDGRRGTGRKPNAPDPAAVAKRQADLEAKRAKAAPKAAAKRAEIAKQDAAIEASVRSRGGAVSTGRSTPRVVATQDRIKAALNDCVLALTRALQDPGLDADLAIAESALPPEFRMKATTARLRKLTSELDAKIADLTKTSRAARDSAARQ
jgi:ParB-like chromosome segregation protein Spo0J